MFLSENLKYLRKNQENGMSQAKLAQILGISRAAIMAYESGRAEPRISVLNKMARHFGLSLEELINRKLEKGDSTKNEEEIGEAEMPLGRGRNGPTAMTKVWIALG